MLAGVLGLGALLAVAYAVADKDKIPEYQRRIDKVMRPWAILMAVIALIFLFAP